MAMDLSGKNHAQARDQECSSNASLEPAEPSGGATRNMAQHTMAIALWKALFKHARDCAKAQRQAPGAFSGMLLACLAFQT